MLDNDRKNIHLQARVAVNEISKADMTRYQSINILDKQRWKLRHSDYQSSKTF